MPTVREKAERFRALHQGPRPLIVPNPWDAGSARVLAALGFEALATTSAGFAFTLGRRDGPLAVGRDETLAGARAIVDAVDVPVTADLQNGFAERPDGVAQTIALAAECGLAGASIEDATGDSAHPIYPLDVAVARVAAAVGAARALAYPFVVTARAENFLHGIEDLEDTIARLRAFEAAGADVVYAPLLPDIGALERVVREVRVPVNALAPGPAATIDELARAGARRISLGGALARVALGALQRAGEEVLGRGTFDFLDDAPSFASLSQIMRQT